MMVYQNRADVNVQYGVVSNTCDSKMVSRNSIDYNNEDMTCYLCWFPGTALVTPHDVYSRTGPIIPFSVAYVAIESMSTNERLNTRSGNLSP